MDSDCLICFQSHSTYDCPERKPQCCPDCHLFIKHFSDHGPACGSKQWLFQPYKDLYVKIPIERVIFGCNGPVRFLYDGMWRKPFDAEELYSTESGIMIRFKNETDFAVLSSSFAPIRIAVVVKENTEFILKLMLLASHNKLIVAKNFNQRFDRVAAKTQHQYKTTLIVATPSIANLCLSLSVLHPNAPFRNHEIQYNMLTKMFNIPQELSSTSLPEEQSIEPNNQLVVSDGLRAKRYFETQNTSVRQANCSYCHDEHHGEYCRRFWQRCFECHVPAQEKGDHAGNCSAKNWFASEKYVDVYAKIPAIRAEITFQKPIRFLLDGKLVDAKPGLDVFSATADVQFKFASQSKIVLKTTGFTRIRLPVVTIERKGTKDIHTERIVFMTSADRTIVAANSSRIVNEANVLSEFEHNTPYFIKLSPICRLIFTAVVPFIITRSMSQPTTDIGFPLNSV